MRHGSGKAVGALEAQSAVRVDAVVEAPPFLDHHPGLCHAEEHLLVEAFVPEPVVEALDVSRRFGSVTVQKSEVNSAAITRSIQARKASELHPHLPRALGLPTNPACKSDLLAVSVSQAKEEPNFSSWQPATLKSEP
mgnify:CR=1 FL=1